MGTGRPGGNSGVAAVPQIGICLSLQLKKNCRLGHSLLHPLVGLFGDSLLESPFEGGDRGCNDIGVRRDARLRGSGIFEFWAQEDP